MGVYGSLLVRRAARQPCRRSDHHPDENLRQRLRHRQRGDDRLRRSHVGGTPDLRCPWRGRRRGDHGAAGVAAAAWVPEVRAGSRAGQGHSRRPWPRRSLRRIVVFPGALRDQGLRVRGRLEPDAESARTWRGAWPRGPADAAAEAGRRPYRRRADRPRRSEGDTGGDSRPYAWIDGVHLPRQRQRDGAHGGALWRRLVDAAD